MAERRQRPFRFGVAAGPVESAAAWRELARKAEDLGYATLLVADHMGPLAAPLPALVAAAAETTRLRLGTQVLATVFRNPALLAKEVATVDLLSEGRFELGIGAGWPAGSPTGDADDRQTGITPESPAVRLARLTEAVQVIKGFLESDQPVTFRGKHYQVEGLVPLPRPVQRPHPPIMIAGAGPRILSLAAREADIVNLAPRPPILGRTSRGTMGFGLTMAESVALVREAAGARYAGLELCVFSNNPAAGNPSITDDPDPLLDKLAAELQTTRAAVLDMPATLIGGVEVIVDRLQQHRDQYDITYRIIPSYAIDAFAPVVARLA